jgi:hypothetical protein
MTMKKILMLLALSIGLTQSSLAQSSDCLFKNPLCFYNADILTYLQTLHKHQQYEQMLPYMTGPALQNLSKAQQLAKIENAPFGYQMKRSGVKTINDHEWNLTYTRTILGTQETFKVQCVMKDGKCCVFLDEKQWRSIFKEN